MGPTPSPSTPHPAGVAPALDKEKCIISHLLQKWKFLSLECFSLKDTITVFWSISSISIAWTKFWSVTSVSQHIELVQRANPGGSHSETKLKFTVPVCLWCPNVCECLTGCWWLFLNIFPAYLYSEMSKYGLWCAWMLNCTSAHKALRGIALWLLSAQGQHEPKFLDIL